MLIEELTNKWQPVLEHPDLVAIEDSQKRATVAQLLENTEIALQESGDWSPSSLLQETPLNAVGDMSGTLPGSTTTKYDPVLISLVRRAMPNLIAYDICGVQPMSGPTGLIFALRSRYANTTSLTTEALFNEADTDYSGANTHSGTTGNTAIDHATQTGRAMPTATAESLGDGGTSDFAEMGFTVEKVSVTAQSRALKAEYTTELAQDLKAIHGLDAESELANILSAEILSEINREVVRTVFSTAVAGAADTTTAGIFDLDTDSNGRWSVEKFKGLMFQLDRECNAIAKATRRGKGNIAIVSSDVASALQMAGVLDYAPAISANLNVDDTGNTFVGVLNGRIRVYIDPFSVGNFVVTGYKGSSTFDAGLFYCPYVPLQMVRAIGENTFQPKIGFKTRYGIVANPFATSAGTGNVQSDTNIYYRRVYVENIM